MADGVRSDIPKVVKIDSAKKTPELAAYEGKSKFGIIAPDFRVYIEGVQVPFETIFINDNYGQIPTASITMPYLPFLQEIGRNYPAKVHIFFRDMVSERYYFAKRDGVESDAAEKYEFRVAFSGVIKGATYQKNKNAFGASTTISFQCQHKNYVASEIIASFARFNVNDASVQKHGEVAGSTAGLASFNPSLVAQQAMQGVDSSGEKLFNPISIADKANVSEEDKGEVEYDTSGIPKAMSNYYEQFRGVPGVVLRLWNIMCMDGYLYRDQQDFMSRIYIPLMSNIKYFEGLVGHPLVEDHLEKTRVKEDAPKPAAGASTQMNKLNPLGAGSTSSEAGEVGALGAVATQATEKAIIDGLQSMGGDVPFDAFYSSILQNMLYDTVTLVSPAMRLATNKSEVAEGDEGFMTLELAVAPVETIVRPLMPLYFSPRCNVVYPRMYSSVQINDLYEDAPTRISSVMPEVTQSTNNPIAFRYRAPNNVREATFNRIKALSADSTVTLTDYQKANMEEGYLGTVNMFHETPASHEMGRGVKTRVENMPQWLMYIIENVEHEADPAKGSKAETTRRDFRKMLMDYTDYLYSIANTGYRSGSVTCCHNPYIIPGYPMDIVDPSQDRPSHHAFCTSVSHVISQASVSTEIGFSNAMTYEEMYAFETPTALPWLENLLSIQKFEDSTGSVYTSIANASQEAKDKANQYYMEVLGVGAAFIDDLSEYKYSNSVSDSGIREVRANVDSLEDSLSACRRSIQTMASVERLYDFKFIDTKGLPAAGTGGKVIRNYPFRPAKTTGQTNTSKFVLSAVRPGHNLFLNYDRFLTDPARVVTAKAGSSYVLGGSVMVDGGDVNSDSDYNVKTEYFINFGRMKSKNPTHYATIQRIDDNLFAQYGGKPFPENYKKGLFQQLLQVESSLTWVVNKGSTNPAKWAYGYGQILPKYHDGRWKGKKVADLTPEENIQLSAEILHGEFRRFKNWNDAVVAYNQGGGTVRKAMQGGRAFYKLCTLDHGGATYFNKVFMA